MSAEYWHCCTSTTHLNIVSDETHPHITTGILHADTIPVSGTSEEHAEEAKAAV